MKVTLFDFQRDALHQLRDKIVAARKFASTDNPQAIAFSAPTGSGKTIIMTALFEAIYVCQFARVLHYFLRTESEKQSNGDHTPESSGAAVSRVAHAEWAGTPRGAEKAQKRQGQPRTVGLEFWWWSIAD